MHTASTRCPLALLVLLFAALPSIAAAQETEGTPPGVRQPLRRFATDVRASMPRFKQLKALSDAIGVDQTDLPTRGLGLVVGAHVYPARMGRVALGVGGEWMTSRASRTEEVDEETTAEGPSVKTRFSTLSPQISLNFGASDGWSYVSGGLGWSRFSVERVESTGGSTAVETESEPRRKTINYGGGARWFANEHVAVSLDLRFYAVSPQLAEGARPALPRMTVMVFSVGAAFR